MLTNLIAQARNSVQQRLYSKASAEYMQAVTEFPAEAIPLLEQEYQNAVSEKQYQTALAVGVALLSKDQSNAVFANTLGNYARITENRDQAMGLYRHALLTDKKFLRPLYNIAAMSAGSQRFDQDAGDAYTYFPADMEYVVPEYFIVNKNNSYECRPDYLNEIKPSVISYLKFRRRESGDSSLKNPLGENNNISLNTGEQTDTDSGVTLTHQDYLEYFNKTSLGNTDRTSLLLYNKLIYCMKHKLFDEASATLPMIKPDFGYPAKYLDLCHAIIGSVNNNYANAENTLNTLIGKEEYNRYYIVNMGLLQRKNKKIMSAVKYLIMGYELLSSSNWRYELKLYIAELNEKFIAIGPGIVKGALLNLYHQKAEDPLLFFNLGLIKLAEKSFVESAALMKKTYTSDDEYIIAQAKKQINRIYDYLCTEAEALFAANKFRQANELYLMAYQVDKNITIIRKILSVFDYYTPDQKELELRAGLRRELTEMENEFRNTSNLRKNQIREEDLEKNRRQFLKQAENYIREKQYHNAIPLYESAFRIQPDRDVFTVLVQLYKALKKNDELVDLVKRYKKLIAHEEKIKKFETASNVKV